MRRRISDEEIAQFAERCGLSKAAPERYSHLLVVNLIANLDLFGVDPGCVVNEILHLEGVNNFSMTKPASEFKKAPLAGLWHKHYFSGTPNSFAVNLINQYGKTGIREICKEIFAPHFGEKVTEEMIKKMADRIVNDAFSDRVNEGKATGEWIVYAKNNGRNYYLTLATHTCGNQRILNNIKLGGLGEFKFLADLSP